MANYTIEVRSLLAKNYHFALDDYPIFEEAHREELNRKILDHYYFREIGAETPDRFNFYLRRKMNEIMPYYNQLYISEMIKFDPMASDYYAEKRELDRANVSQTGKQNTEKRNTDGKSVYSDTGEATGNALVTNNLKENIDTTGKKDATTNRDINTVQHDNYSEDVTYSENKTNVFCDDPQTQLTSYTDDDGNIVNNKYATTETFDKITGNKHTTGSKDSNTTTNDDTVYDEDTSGNSVKTNTGTVNTDTVDKNKTNGETRSYGESSTVGVELNNKEEKENNTENTEAKGRRGFNPSELLLKYRKTFLNIDMMIVEELNSLFMGVYE